MAWLAGHQAALLRSLEVRMSDRAQGLQKKLAERCDKDVADMTAVLSEFHQQNKFRRRLSKRQR